MQQHLSLFAFMATDDFKSAITVNIKRNGILWRLSQANGDSRPKPFDVLRPRIQIKPNHARLFPACNDILQAISVEITKSHAVSAPKRAINRVPNPRLICLRCRDERTCPDDRQQQQRRQTFRGWLCHDTNSPSRPRQTLRWDRAAVVYGTRSSSPPSDWHQHVSLRSPELPVACPYREHHRLL